MERSYGFLSNYFQNQHLLIAHLRDLYNKGLDVPSSIPLICVRPKIYLHMLCQSQTFCAIQKDDLRSVSNFASFYLLIIRVFIVLRIYDFKSNSSVASDDALEAFFGSSKMHCPCTLTRQSALSVIFTQGIHSRQNKAIDEKIAARRRRHWRGYHRRADFESWELNRWGKKDPTRESQYLLSFHLTIGQMALL